MSSRVFDPLRRTRLTVFLALTGAISTAGCLSDTFHKWGAAAGHGALGGGVAYLRSDSGRAAVRTVVDTSAAAIAVALRASLLPTLDSAFERSAARLTERSSVALYGARDSLIATVRGPLSGALQELVAANIAAASRAGRTQWDAAVVRAAYDFDTRVLPRVDTAATHAADAVITRVVAAMDSNFRATINATVASAVRAGVEAGTSQFESTKLWRRLTFGAVTAGVVGLALAAWLGYRVRRTRRALESVADVIESRDDAALKEQVRRRAQQLGVEPTLHDVLAKKGYSRA